MWSFFGTGHGKGPHDGAGVVLKRYIQTAQLDINGPKLQCAGDVVGYLRKELSDRPKTIYGDRRHVNRTFWHVLKGDVLIGNMSMIVSPYLDANIYTLFALSAAWRLVS
jgi:hypothetical protein